MPRCINRFILPILLFYIGFIFLGSLVGLAIGLAIGAILISVIIGFFIGFTIAIIFNAFTLIIINKVCYKNDSAQCFN